MSHHNGRVYLAGPIAGVSGDEAIDWRVDTLAVFRSLGIGVRDPMRAKHALKTMDTISRTFHDYENKGVFFTSRGIMTRDFNDVKQSDVLLVNLLGAKTPSLGTIMELAWAFALQKPCVVAIEKTGNPHDNHPMIHEAISFRVETLDEAIRSVAVILGCEAGLYGA
jgi:nucleoside 2-deoxyribosyltransferase